MQLKVHTAHAAPSGPACLAGPDHNKGSQEGGATAWIGTRVWRSTGQADRPVLKFCGTVTIELERPPLPPPANQISEEESPNWGPPHPQQGVGNPRH